MGGPLRKGNKFLYDQSKHGILCSKHKYFLVKYNPEIYFITGEFYTKKQNIIPSKQLLQVSGICGQNNILNDQLKNQ